MTSERFRIVEASGDEAMRVAAALFREYACVLPHGLENTRFEEELATLPGKYARPDGCILLAPRRQVAVGCVAMRELAPMPGEIGRSLQR
ncbi:MAG: hypothetical protein KF705_09605 [Phycisphaeraceae bacterium]|nr:hypothetical protein [Phycisphaeraceae bacterium]